MEVVRRWIEPSLISSLRLLALHAQIDKCLCLCICICMHVFIDRFRFLPAKSSLSFRRMFRFQARPSETTRLVVDTDAGVDDAIALMLALHHLPIANVLGITTVFGNVSLSQANHNVRKILQVMGYSDDTIPVHSGAHKPLVSSMATPWQGHGPDGLGGTSGVVPSREKTQDDVPYNHAAHALIEYANKYPGELTIVALGPLTNVALAASIDSTFASRIKKLIFMGCTTRDNGNTTPFAEFNVASDPEATHIVFQHFPANVLHIVSWDLCLDHVLSWDFFDVLTACAHPRATFLRELCSHYEEECRHANIHSFAPCDAYAMAMILHESYVQESEEMHAKVELSHGERRGANMWHPNENKNKAWIGKRLQPSLIQTSQQQPLNATVVSRIDLELFKSMLLSLVQKETESDAQ